MQKYREKKLSTNIPGDKNPFLSINFTMVDKTIKV